MPLHAHSIKCKGKSRRDGHPCKNLAVTGREYCRMHGGKIPVGIANPAYRHGNQSKYPAGLPARYRDTFLASLEDQNYLMLHSDIALTRAREEELLGQLDQIPSDERISTILSRLNALRFKCKELDYTEIIPGLDKVTEELITVQGQASIWKLIQENSEHKRKLAETERKRIDASASVLRANEALAFVQGVLMDIKTHVTDQDVLNRLVMAIQQRLPAPTTPQK